MEILKKNHSSIIVIFLFTTTLFSQYIPVNPYIDTDSSSLKIAYSDIVRIGFNCSGYRFPGTNYIWTLKNCLANNNSFCDSVETILITSKNFNPLKNNTLVQNYESTFADTFKYSKVVYIKDDWVIIEILNEKEVNSEFNKPYFFLPPISGEIVVGYPDKTNFQATPIENYFDWILIPQWQFQFDTFMYNHKMEELKNLRCIKNKSIENLKLLISDKNEDFINIKNIDSAIFTDFKENEALEFCKQKWTDNQFIRNRIATLSTLTDESIKYEKISSLLKRENRSFELIGLATRLYITFSLLPVHVLPESATELLLTFGKDYIEAAKFLIDQPEILNKINLNIRSIEKKVGIKMEDREMSDKKYIYLGTGDLQIISNQEKEADKTNLYWKAFGLGGGAVFENGKLRGIQRYIPFYNSRKLTIENEIDFIPMGNLVEIQKSKNNLDLWKKISGFIFQ